MRAEITESPDPKIGVTEVLLTKGDAMAIQVKIYKNEIEIFVEREQPVRIVTRSAMRLRPGGHTHLYVTN